MFYAKVLAAEAELGDRNAAIAAVAKGKVAETAKSYFNKGRREYQKLLRSGAANTQAVWPNSRGRPRNSI